jgi:dolichol-phosphate mannosyltransferase
VTAPTLSVVMPVYNEAPSIADVVRDISRYVLDEVPGSELVVVDDRSTDETGAVLDELARADARIRLLVNDVNMGHGRSVRRAIDESCGDWIFHLDSDGQVDVAEFALLWARRFDDDLILGVRVDRHDPFARLVLTRITRLLVSALARRWVRDSNAPFKLVHRPLFDHLATTIPTSAFAPSILIVLGAHRCGAAVSEVPITHFARAHGRSTLHPWRLTKAVARSGVETLRFNWRPHAPYARAGLDGR